MHRILHGLQLLKMLGGHGAESPRLSPFYIFDWSFYQDRLGTDKRKKGRFLQEKCCFSCCPCCRPSKTLSTVSLAGMMTNTWAAGDWRVHLERIIEEYSTETTDGHPLPSNLSMNREGMTAQKLTKKKLCVTTELLHINFLDYVHVDYVLDLTTLVVVWVAGPNCTRSASAT